tara:strand:+ start:53 stop:562 length:510 start_codon:yes stop_codon:yes gene_type:complete
LINPLLKKTNISQTKKTGISTYSSFTYVGYHGKHTLAMLLFPPFFDLEVEGAGQHQSEAGPFASSAIAFREPLMVKHIVMFKLKKKNPANLEKAAQALQGLEGEIEALRSLEIGIDFTQGERSYDIVLTTHFDDRSGFDTYGPHPKHIPVIETMRALCSNSIVVDYEVP